MNSLQANRLFWILGLAGIFLILVLIYFRDPHVSGHYPPCPFYWLTGLYCPGCGSMRAVHDLLHFHWLTALRSNPLMIFSLPFLAIALARMFYRDTIDPNLPRWQIAFRWDRWVLGILIAYWILRNLQWFPLRL